MHVHQHHHDLTFILQALDPLIMTKLPTLPLLDANDAEFEYHFKVQFENPNQHHIITTSRRTWQAPTLEHLIAARTCLEDRGSLAVPDPVRSALHTP